MSYLLGTWHTFKYASNSLRAAASLYIGPMFHFIHPGSHFKAEGKHFTNQWWFTVMRLSYPDWKDQLKELLEDDEYKFNCPNGHAHATNLRDLFEYFIPAVGA